jgi:hypothetical protein
VLQLGDLIAQHVAVVLARPRLTVGRLYEALERFGVAPHQVVGLHGMHSIEERDTGDTSGVTTLPPTGDGSVSSVSPIGVNLAVEMGAEEPQLPVVLVDYGGESVQFALLHICMVRKMLERS